MTKLKSIEDLFAGRHCERDCDSFLRAVYLRYELSLRDLVEMMAERGFVAAHAPKDVPWETTILLGLSVIRRSSSNVGTVWACLRDVVACDDIYLKIRGKWVYLYRAWIGRSRPRTSCSAPGATWRRQSLFQEGNQISRPAAGNDHASRLRRVFACSDGQDALQYYIPDAIHLADLISRSH